MRGNKAESRIFYYGTFPQYASINKGAVNCRINYADVSSIMDICCFNDNAQPNTIISRACITKVDNLNNEHVIFGPSVTNPNGTPQGSFVESVVQDQLTQWVGVGDIGANAWGDGGFGWNAATKPSCAVLNVAQLTMVGESIYYVPGNSCYTYQSIDSETDNLTNEIEWGHANFVGADGLLYGVPFADENGEAVIPDMLRVKLDDGTFGYVARDAMDKATIGYAETPEERSQVAANMIDQETEAFQRAFAEYFGVDVLSDVAARECVDKVRYKGGMEKARVVVETDSCADLAKSIRDGAVSKDKAIGVIEDGAAALSDVGSGELAINISSVEASDVSITEDVFDAIYDIALSYLYVSVPAYAEDGTTVLGEFEFARM